MSSTELPQHPALTLSQTLMQCSSSLSSDSHAHKNRKKIIIIKKKKGAAQFPSRRVCYANDSVVSLTQEKQLCLCPSFWLDWSPEGYLLWLKEKKVWAHHLKSLGKCEGHKPPVWGRAKPCACNGHALEAAAVSRMKWNEMKWKEAVAVYVGSRFKL